MKQCEKFLDCPFFRKFPNYVRSYKFIYCEGPKMESCARLNYREKHGVKPPDGLTPTGLVIEKDI